MNVKLVIEPHRELIQETLVQNILIACIPLKETKDKKFQKLLNFSWLVLLSNNDISNSKLFSLYRGIYQISNYFNDVRSTDIQEKKLN